MKIIFAGTPDFAASHLQALIDAGLDVCAVYTQPDRPRGRGHKLLPSPVKEIALEHHIPVMQPESLKKDPEAVREFLDLKADLLVVVAYGLILPDDVIAGTKLGAINVHGSLLPRWRGAAPIQRSLWAGDKETGVTIMKIVSELDAGDALSHAKVAITATDTSESLYTKLAQIGPKALVEAINNIETLLPNAVAQDPALVTYATKLSKEEARLDWTQTAEITERHIRAYIPWPVAYFPFEGENVKVFGATCQVGQAGAQPGKILDVNPNGVLVATGNNTALLLTRMQFPGKKPLAFKDIYNARKDLFKVNSVLA
ncbi:MAG: methionyl-tRNA formyltransferase [Succinivibrionaceae bacterium]|nr:methionyl-tRNA formyltransferase [Succinivibrionaceae bacterium]